MTDDRWFCPVTAWRAGGQHETYKGGSKLVDVAAGQVITANFEILLIVKKHRK